MYVGRDSLVLSSTLVRVRSLYEGAKREGVVVGNIADSYVLGEDGEVEGYQTQVLATVPISNGLGLISTSASVWHIGKKDGYRVVLETGHEIVVERYSKLLVNLGTHREFIPVSEVVERLDSEKVTIPLYMLTYPRRIPCPPREAVITAMFLLSRIEQIGNQIKILPTTDASIIINEVANAFKVCIVERVYEKYEGLIFDAACSIFDQLRSVEQVDVVSFIERTPLPVLAGAGYFIGLQLHNGAELTEELSERIPYIALVLQLAGWVLKIGKNEVKALRYREPVYYAGIARVEKAQNDFYCVAPSCYQGYVANGLVVSS